MTNRTRQSMTVTLDHEVLKKIDDRVAALSPPGSPPRTRSWVVEQLLLSALGTAHEAPTKPSTPPAAPPTSTEERIAKLSKRLNTPADLLKETLLHEALNFRNLPGDLLSWVEPIDYCNSPVENLEALVTLGWQAYFGTHESPPWRTPTHMRTRFKDMREYATFNPHPDFFQKP